MSGFDLVPVDGGDPVHLPPGETVLGRGPLLGVSDRRVSRNHGLLENLNGQLRLKATHLNPCFVQPSPDDDPRPLTKGSWHPLRHGDLLSLLPGLFVYKVVAVSGEDAAARNSQATDDRDPPPGAGQSGRTPPPLGGSLPAPSDQGDDRRPDKNREVATPAQEMGDGVTPSPRRRRVLPPWMLASVSSPPDSSPSAKAKRRREPAAAGGDEGTAPQATIAAAAKGAGLKNGEKKPRKERGKTAASHTPRPDSGAEGPSDEEVKGGRASDRSPRAPTSPDSGSGNVTPKLGQNAAGKDVTGASTAAPRKACPYGKDCYRKNPLHFQECSHPGDGDYQEEEEDEEDRPECPYGTDCYRKNPLHRKEYKHTRRPGRSRKAAAAGFRAAAAGEDEASDDSFITDSSGDGDDDSDYVPPDSDDGGEKEDVKRLQREARAFMRRPK